MNQILALNNPYGVYMSLNKWTKRNIYSYDCYETFTNDLNFGIK